MGNTGREKENGETNKTGRKRQWLCREIIKTGINPESIRTKGLSAAGESVNASL